MKQIYYATFENEKPSLSIVFIYSETKYTISIRGIDEDHWAINILDPDPRNVIYVNWHRVPKSNDNNWRFITYDHDEAIEWLRNKMWNQHIALLKKVRELDDCLKHLKTIDWNIYELKDQLL